MQLLDSMALTRKRVSAVCLLAAGIGAGSFLLLRGAGPQASGGLAVITLDYPAEGSLFPPEITPPTFLWRDAAANVTSWTVDIAFPDGAQGIRVKSSGVGMHIGEIDPEAVSQTNELPKLTPEQAAAHTWTPDAGTWEAIKTHSAGSPATIAITGFRDGDLKQPVSRGQVKIETSRDPAGAPIFYRDVPLMPNRGNKGVISPLAPEAIGLIKWRLRYLDEARSRVVMEKISTCANCHSFSADGKTLGLDVDGPQNDRGLYALIPVARQTAIRTQDVIKWPTVRDPAVPRLRAAFMSQVSPDGRYVLSTIDDRDAAQRAEGRTLEDKYYVANFRTTGSCRCSIRHAALWPGTIARPGVCSRCRAPMTLDSCKPAVCGARTESTLCSSAPKRRLPIHRDSRLPATPTTPRKRRSNTTFTRFRSTREKGANRSRFGARPRTG